MEVHPVADLFPMLPDDELAELAESIGQRGLLHPIVVDANGRILDGRNRFAACQLAEIEPEFVTYRGADPDGYALAVNIARRNLTKGQIAMIAARALFVSNNGQADAAKATGVSQARIGYAATVIEFAPDLVDAVVAGAKPLDKAYDEARDRKKAAATDEARFDRLPPDLADMVRDERASLDEAEAVAKVRADKARREEEERERSSEAAADTVRRALAVLANPAYLEALIKRLPLQPLPPDKDELTQARKALATISRRTA
jgi:ParB/RepB/Spo0J family partition protein